MIWAQGSTCEFPCSQHRGWQLDGLHDLWRGFTLRLAVCCGRAAGSDARTFCGSARSTWPLSEAVADRLDSRAAAITSATTLLATSAEQMSTPKSASGSRAPAAAQAATQGRFTMAVRHFAALCTARASLVDGCGAAACRAVVIRCVQDRDNSGVYLQHSIEIRTPVMEKHGSCMLRGKQGGSARTQG